MLKSDISIPLSKIFNLSMRTGTHPDCLKLAMVVPIHKKEPKLKVGNYRPISLLWMNIENVIFLILQVRHLHFRVPLYILSLWKKLFYIQSRVKLLEAFASVVKLVKQFKNVESGMILSAWLFWLVINFDSISVKSTHYVTA